MLFTHVVYRPREENPRYLFAKESWRNAGIHTLFYSDVVDRGQKLIVPLINDIINEAFRITGSEFVLYTNSDIALVKETMEELEPFLVKGSAWYVPNKQVKKFDCFFQDASEVGHLPEPKWGADVFLVSRQWWVEKQKFFADFLIGYPCWDEVLIDLIGKKNLLPSIAYHEEHPSYWKSTDCAFDKGLLLNIENAGFNTLAIVIPFYCTSLSSLRLRNLLFVLGKLREKWNGPVFVSLQRSEVAFEISKLLKRFGVSVEVPQMEETGLSKKSELVNDGVRRALAWHPFKYILQLDADLFSSSLGGLIWNWVRNPEVDASFVYSDFFFLTRILTQAVVRGEKLNIDTSKLYKPTGFGPGGFLVKSELFRKVGGMPEQFEGWGLEDTAFGDSLKAAGAKIEECKLPAFHLYHENDRHINRKSFRETMRFSESTLEECKYLASDKFAVFNLSNYHAIEEILHRQDSIFIADLSSLDDKKIHQILRKTLVTEESLEEKYKLLGFTSSKVPSKALIETLVRRDFTVILVKLSSQSIPDEFNKLLSNTVSIVIDLDYFYDSKEKTLKELGKALGVKLIENFELEVETYELR